MMNGVSFIALAILMISTAVSCSADRYFCDLKSGKFSANFNCGADGLAVWYDGVRVIRNSTMWLHNPAWNKHYYGFNQLKGPIEVRDVDGGKEAVLSHRSEYFEGTQRIAVRGDELVVELKCKLLQDIKDADMEYGFAKMCAAPILGRPYTAVTNTGESVKGIVPIRATSSDSWTQPLTPNPFTELVIDTRIGKMKIETSGNVGSLTAIDYRMNAYHEIDDIPFFWCGTNWHMDFGKEYTHKVVITMQPHAKPAAVKPPTASTKIEQDNDLRLAQYGPVFVIPEPQQIKLTQQPFMLTANTRIVVADSAKRSDLRGARTFAEEVGLLYGFQPKIVREREAGNAPAILVGEAASNRLLASAAAQEGVSAPLKAEGYALKVTPSCVLVLGHDQRGSYYGMQTLKQLLSSDAKGVVIHGCEINDWPSLPFRGVHLFTSNEALGFHKKLIDRILARYKMNNIILEVDFLKWDTDPTIAVPWAQDQSEIKEEIEYAKESFIEINPLLQSLGHCDWLFMTGKNRDIAENPDRPYAYCPTNPRTYPYIFKFYDETVKLFDNPRYVHIGHDEVEEPGGFPRHEECKKRSAEQIFVDDTLKVREHLSKYGARVMMWGDMLLAKGDSPDATNAADAKTAKWIRDQLPKDVVITDWHYAPAQAEEYKSLKLFMDEGHDVIAATWDTHVNIEQFAQQAKNVGAMGLLQTTWAGFKSAESNLRESFKQFSAFVLAAEYAWNNGKTDLDHLPYNADEEFRRQWNPKSLAAVDKPGFTVDLSKAYNVSLADNSQFTGWLGLGAGDDLSELPTGETRLRGDLYKLAADNTKPSAIRLASSLDDRIYPDLVNISIDRKADALLFLHTCAWTDQSNRKIGAYKVHYFDGTSETIDLFYGANIISWLDMRSIGGAENVWGGRTKENQRVSLFRVQWDNPHPQKKISSVEFSTLTTEAGPTLIGLSGLESK